MKLSLRQEENASVLEIQGNIDIHNFTVLKAGLSKLFHNGKNRIVVYLKDTDQLATEVIRELAILDVFARELSGKLVLVSDSEDMKQKVQTFAKPPVVAILPTVAKALEYLRDLDALEGDEGGESLSEVSAQLEAKARQVAALEAQIKQTDPREAQKLRAENAELKDKLKLLETQLGEILGGKRAQPSDAEGFLEKFDALEDSVRRLSGEKAAGAK